MHLVKDHWPPSEKARLLSGLRDALLQEWGWGAGSPQPLPVQGGWHRGRFSKEVDVWIDSEARPAFPEELQGLWSTQSEMAGAHSSPWLVHPSPSLSQGTCPGRWAQNSPFPPKNPPLGRKLGSWYRGWGAFRDPERDQSAQRVWTSSRLGRPSLLPALLQEGCSLKGEGAALARWVLRLW